MVVFGSNAKSSFSSIKAIKILRMVPRAYFRHVSLRDVSRNADKNAQVFAIRSYRSTHLSLWGAIGRVSLDPRCLEKTKETLTGTRVNASTIVDTTATATVAVKH